jgi:hypothetical protein
VRERKTLQIEKGERNTDRRKVERRKEKMRKENKKKEHNFRKTRKRG